ncbi:hypothetical protein XA68_15115 [Ophiocordyceps unilateralis]|uniref:Uncharacterized protein n=1 Tax=Ophiocordyceps unilateralis TaxID=268505 RepID=A0A2A9P964_OPHUN|nr:hypothetical protein XA68_15115 [Ophiocordyceps unilateralis]
MPWQQTASRIDIDPQISPCEANLKVRPFSILNWFLAEIALSFRPKSRAVAASPSQIFPISSALLLTPPPKPPTQDSLFFTTATRKLPH